MSYEEYGARVWKNGELQYDREDVEINGIDWHGVIGSGDIKCCCRKQGLPTIFDGAEEVDYCAGHARDEYEYEPFDFEYKGNRFHFENGYEKETPYSVTMTEPDGTFWECKYDYNYGAGADYLNSDNNWAAIFQQLLEEDRQQRAAAGKDGNDG